ncbi:MAG: tetratricopeptide repeat protein [Pseudomonadota bacterium]
MGLVPAAAQTPDQQQPATPEEPRLPGEPALPDAPPMPPTPDEMPAIEEALSGLEIPSEELGREAQLEALFRQLGDAENPHWPIIQGQIWRVWRRSGSASMDLLLHRAQEAIEKKDYTTAFVHLDDLVRLAPEFAEGWNQRATAYFLTEDYGRSMRDIEAVLALEPRHFGALSGLGIILDRTGNDAGALRAFRRALELHPNLPGAQKGVDKLSEQVDGQEH